VAAGEVRYTHVVYGLVYVFCIHALTHLDAADTLRVHL
jgi:hypothetical protein